MADDSGVSDAKVEVGVDGAASGAAVAAGAAAAAPEVEDVTATREGNASLVEVTSDDLALYTECKDELEETLRKEGNVYFTDRGPFAGILNQGATCYMNSLLQSLFHTPRFTKRLFEWVYKPERDGASEFCIPLALQKLFAKLQGGTKAAYSTKTLTHSFRWTNSNSFQQHDVQEFCGKLFTALEEATEGYTMVDDLYEGEMIDFLGCRSCAFSRKRTEKFRDLELEICVPNVLESLRLYKNQEVLCGDNQWYCDRCSCKVDAVKGVKLKTLPPVLTLHLKRFSFDFRLMKRIKLSNSFGLVPRLKTADFMESDMVDGEGDEYELFAIMIHQGTARGGHYFAYIKPPNGDDWYEFNDVNVKKLDPKDVQQGFDMADAAAAAAVTSKEASTTPPGGEGADATAPAEAATKPAPADGAASGAGAGAGADGAGKAAGAGSGASTSDAAAATDPSSASIGVSVVANNMCHNAYLVMYRKVGGKDEAVELPAPLQAMVTAENRRYEKMHKVYSIRQAVVVLEIYTADNRKVQLDVPTARSMEEATALAYAALWDEAAQAAVTEAGGEVPPLERCRLRRFVPLCSRPTETFEGRLHLPLHVLGVVNAAAMLLESRRDDEVFEAFNPNEMVARIVRWDAEAKEGDVATAQIVKVEGDQEATVGQLTAAVEAATGIPAAQQRLVYCDERTATVMTLRSPETQLRREFRYRTGEDIILEVLGDGESMADESPVVRQFDLTRNVITICYNAPDTPLEVDRVTPSNLNETLGELKAKIAQDLGLDPDDFHLRRSGNAPQLKDTDKTLRDLDLVDQSMVFVQMGAPMSPDQFALEVFIYDADNKKQPFQRIISDFPASETQSIGSLKRRIAAHVKVNHPASKLRMRDKARSTAGKIYRDRQSVRYAMRNVGDGREVCVQLLDFVERTTKQDMVLALRIWRPLKRTIRSTDVVIKRASTVSQLWATLHDRYAIGLPPPLGAEEDETKGEAAADATTADEAGTGSGAGGAAGESELSDTVWGDPPASDEAVAKVVAALETKTDEEAAAVAAALEEFPRGIGIVKMPMFPKLSLKTAWQYRWNEPKFTGNQVVSMSGFRDGNTYVVRDEAEFAVAKIRREARRAAKKAADKAAGKTTKPRTKRKPWRPPNRGNAFPRHENTLTIGRGADAAAPAASGPDWACGVCTFANPGSRGSCEMCGSPRPAAPPPAPSPAPAGDAAADTPAVEG